ncbi:CDP-archaeol synthase [Thiohalobacter sp.]|uniref:CDP-archaeol synthase n=1 Tax=Thiohalobacter sp. TaxID=2025948 RepID=UPI002612AB1A|nr:CDP-archaeol synthase [Thiohalobacter sp.]
MPEPWIDALIVLGLLILANGAPILARLLAGGREGRPVDGGRRAPDGRPWLGPSKTWRGILAAVLLTPLAAWVLGEPALAGLLIGIGAMAGDLLASFVKRRMGIPSSGMALGLDQIPESLLPLLLVEPLYRFGPWQLLAMVMLFLVAELVLSRILYALHIRKHPW